MASDLQDAAFGGQVALQYHVTAGGFQRFFEFADDYLSGSLRGIGRFFGDGPAGNGDLTLMEHAAFQHALRNEPVAARGEEVVGDETSAWLEVGEQRRFFADSVEILDLQIHARFLGDGQQMQHAVGRSARGEHGCDGVLEGLPGHNVPGTDIPAHQVHYLAAAFAGHFRFVRMGSGHARAADGRDTQHFEGDGHGVCRELTAAGAGAGTGMIFHVLQFQVGHPAGGMGAHRLENVLDGDVVLLEAARHDRTAVEHQGRYVHPAEGHDGARYGLVAAGKGDEPVEHVPDRDQFDGIRNNLPAYQGGLHPLAAHGDTVGYGYGIELHGRATRLPDAFFHVFGKVPEMIGTGTDFNPGVGDSDDRP